MQDGWQNLATNFWVKSFPLKLLGANMRRNVSVIRLASGKLIIHSTAPFSTTDVAVISALGGPAWLVDTLLRHDTFARQGKAAFPQAQYLAPAGFSIPAGPLLPPPAEWKDEIAIAAIDGAPDFGEVVMLHRPSRTLVVADLLFNFGEEEGWWTKLLLSAAAVGGQYQPGMTKPFKAAIKDPAAFASSIREILAWDFDRIVVGHGIPIVSGGKEKLRSACR